MNCLVSIFLVCLLPLVSACSLGGVGKGVQQVTPVELKPPPPGPVQALPYRLHRGDVLAITFPLNPELNADQTIRPDGKIVLKLVGEVTALGLTMDELKNTIAGKYRDFVTRTRYSQVLKEGDYFDLKFVYNPELNIGVRVRSDGKVSLPLVGDVKAAELTPAEMRLVLIQEYSREIVQPDIALLVNDSSAKRIYTDANDVAVVLTKAAGQLVFVGGEVKLPKTVVLMGRMTALQAISEAGGVLESGDISKVVVLRRGEFEQAEWFQIDLHSPLVGDALKNDIVLRGGDLVVVPRSGIYQLNLYVRQYIRDLLPLQSSAGVNFQILDRAAIPGGTF